MSKIVTLSLLWAKSLFKEKSTYLFGVMAAVIILLSIALSGTEIGRKYKLFEDILLTSQGYFFILAALFYAFFQESRDRNLGLFVLPVANGMSRNEYLMAKMLSLAWVILSLFVMFILLDTVALAVVEGAVEFLLLWQLFLYTLSALLVAYMIVSLSQYVSLTNALLYSITLFLIGHALDELYIYTRFLNDSTLLREMAGVLYYLLPNFSLFDHQGAIVNRQGMEIWSGMVLPLIYFIVWTMILFLVAAAKFKKKALTVGN